MPSKEMLDKIRNFPKQFDFEPVIGNVGALKQAESFVVLGMGGSNLTASLIQTVDPFLDLICHRDYGLPALKDATLRNNLIIASSYSGNTEEILDGFNAALVKGLDVAVIAKGGKLLDLAKQNSAPFVELPSTDVQPRISAGFQLMALLKLMGKEEELKKARLLSRTINANELEKEGERLAGLLSGKIPVVYSSLKNLPLARNWKIKFNETAKIPAFFNVFPELNHNEMTGFDAASAAKALSEYFYFIFLEDDSEANPRVLRRMSVLRELYTQRGLPVEQIKIADNNTWEKIFNTVLIADFAAYFLAKHYDVDPEQVPMVEEFKRMII